MDQKGSIIIQTTRGIVRRVDGREGGNVQLEKKKTTKGEKKYGVKENIVVSVQNSQFFFFGWEWEADFHKGLRIECLRLK